MYIPHQYTFHFTDTSKMDDNTSVIRMKRDFDKFISGDRLPCRLDLDQSIGSSLIQPENVYSTSIYIPLTLYFI
jgi:hypothetical protein